MANTYRGETPFRALGRDLFIAYRTPEIGAIQRALGYCEPPGQPARVTTEQVPALNLTAGTREHVADEDGRMLAALNEDGTVKMRTVIVDSAERRRRFIEAFDAALLHPSADELTTMVRCGLAPWEHDNGRLSPEEWARLVEELGFAGLQLLHSSAVAAAYRVMLPAAEKEEPKDDDPNATRPASATQT